nr:MAG TPA: hypothetical protein [Caudoviricetes sp.]
MSVLRLCNEIITIINSRFDSEQDCDAYSATVVSGASWFCEIASNVDGSGLKAADKYTIRIPQKADCGKAYVDPLAYESADPSAAFTLKNGDIVVRGAVTGEDLRPSALQKRYSEVVTILGVTDNRRAPHAPHWKVVGA